MVSQRKQPGVVDVIVGCAVSLWFFIPAGPTGTSQAIVGSNEPPTFVAGPRRAWDFRSTYPVSRKTSTR